MNSLVQKIRHIVSMLFCLIFLFNIPSIKAQWLWQNPIPNDNNFLSMQFTDTNNGYAVGSNGTLFKTINGGANWTVQQSGTMNSLNSIFFVDVNIGYIVGDAGTIFKTIDGGKNWTTQNSGTIFKLTSVYFIDANNGWAVGLSGTIITTSNGGVTWNSQTSPTGNYLSTVYFTDANTGYAVGDMGIILKTTDGGSIWTIQTNGNVNNLYSIDFIDNNKGIAVGTDGTIVKTEDAGVSWTTIGGGSGIILNNVNFFDATLGYIVGNDGTVLKTIDGGTNWSPQVNVTNQHLKAIRFINSNKGFLVGHGGIIAVTTDGAANWTVQWGAVTQQFLYSVAFSDENNGYAVGFVGSLLKTTDGGTTWTVLNGGTSQSLFSVVYTDPNTAYAVGGAGTILKTTGGNWSSLNSGTTRKLKSVFFVNLNTGYAVGDTGTILKTTNAGSSWVALTSGTTKNLLSVHFSDANVGYAVGMSGTIIKTTDGGSNWTAQTSGITVQINGVNFSDSKIGYAVGHSGKILKTTDGGTNWNPQNSGVITDLYCIDLLQENIGYISGYLGVILKTTNGGVNWTKELSNTSQPLYSIFFSNANVGYTVGNYGAILKYVGDASITTQSQPIVSLGDTIQFANTGISMIFDSTLSNLPSDAYVTVTHHNNNVDNVTVHDSIATLFNNFFWNIASNIDSFETEVCFTYNPSTLNTNYINYLTLVYQEQLGQPWSIINSIPTVTDSQICFRTRHWSNWAVAITKPDPKIKLDTIISNTGSEQISVKKSFENSGVSVSYHLKPGQSDTVFFKSYDVNPGGDLPDSIIDLSETFWEFKRNMNDSVTVSIDMDYVKGFNPADSGKYRVLFRPNSLTDWKDVLTYRVKKGMREEVRVRMDSLNGHLILGKTEVLQPIHQVSVQVENVCGIDTIHFQSVVTGLYPPLAYLWSGDDGFSSFEANPAYIFPSGTGHFNYQLDITDRNGMNLFFSSTIGVFDMPVINLGNDTLICEGCSLTLDAGNSGASYLWSTGANTQTITVASIDTFSVMVVDSNGCAMTDSIYVDMITGVEKIDNFDNPIRLYPIPASNLIHLEIESVTGEVRVSLYNLFGKELDRKVYNNPGGFLKYTYNFENEPSQVYIISIETNEQVQYYKIPLAR